MDFIPHLPGRAISDVDHDREVDRLSMGGINTINAVQNLYNTGFDFNLNRRTLSFIKRQLGVATVTIVLQRGENIVVDLQDATNRQNFMNFLHRQDVYLNGRLIKQDQVSVISLEGGYGTLPNPRLFLHDPRKYEGVSQLYDEGYNFLPVDINALRQMILSERRYIYVNLKFPDDTRVTYMLKGPYNQLEKFLELLQFRTSPRTIQLKRVSDDVTDDISLLNIVSIKLWGSRDNLMQGVLGFCRYRNISCIDLDGL